MINRLHELIEAGYNKKTITLTEDDAELLESLLNAFIAGQDKGFEDGIEYVISGQMAYDEQKEDALKGTY